MDEKITETNSVFEYFLLKLHVKIWMIQSFEQEAN